MRTQLLAAIFILTLCAGAAHAEPTVKFFDGNTALASLGGWGTGTVNKTDEAEYLGHEVLIVSTGDYASGGRLDLRLPADFGPFWSDPAASSLVIVAKSAPSAPAAPTGPSAIWQGLAGQGELGMREREMRAMGNFPGMPGVGAPAPAAPATAVRRVRVVLQTDTGALDSGPVRLDKPIYEIDGWATYAVSLDQFKSRGDLAGSRLMRVVLSGDQNGRFYVGDLQLVREEGPLRAHILGDRPVNAAIGVPVSFAAEPQRPGVMGSYLWSWDSTLNMDASGQSTSMTFERPGHYKVTLRVMDPSGIKQNKFDQIEVIVGEGEAFAPAM